MATPKLHTVVGELLHARDEERADAPRQRHAATGGLVRRERDDRQAAPHHRDERFAEAVAQKPVREEPGERQDVDGCLAAAGDDRDEREAIEARAVRFAIRGWERPMGRQDFVDIPDSSKVVALDHDTSSAPVSATQLSSSKAPPPALANSARV